MVSALLDWSQCPTVESIPGKIGGAWLFKGTRTPELMAEFSQGYQRVFTFSST